MKPSCLLIVVIQLCSTFLSAQHCLSEGIIFTRQSQIDSFPINYPGCSQIDGDLEIAGEQSDIHSLIGLTQLQSIYGELKIHNLDNVISLQGLNQITFIGGSLRIENNPGLTTCNGFNNLNHLGEALIIKTNDNLFSLIGFDSLHRATSLVVSENNQLLDLTGIENLDTLVFGMTISSNPRLKSLTGLENWKVFFGDLRIYNNDSLINLSGLHNLVTLFGTFNVSGNANLLSFQGADSLKEIYGDFEAFENGLTAFAGLDRLESIHGSFIVKSNQVLQNFMGLSRLQSVGALSFTDNSTLTSLAGLEGLQTITNSVGILSNTSLVDLSALINASNLKGQIIIQANTALPSLYGLDHLCNTFINKVDVSYNDHLSDCAVASICIHLTHGGVYFIGGNSTGCNTREEIINDCLTATQNPGILDDLYIYPNPTYERIEITSSLSYPNSFSLLDPSGKILTSWPGDSTSLDISEFAPGMYILNIQFANQQVNRRVIKL